MTKLTTTIGVPIDTHQRAVKAAAECGLKIGEYSAAAIDFFAERGLNPKLESTRQTEVIVAEIRKLGHRLFGFLQEQERGVLGPLLEEMVRGRYLQEETLDYTLQTMLQVYGDTKFLETGREKVRSRVAERVEKAMQELRKSGPGKH